MQRHRIGRCFFTDKIISTPCGKIKGTGCRLPGVLAFKGIRYATSKRWEYPDEVTGWDGIYDACSYGNSAFQPRSFYDEETKPEKSFYYREFRRGESYSYGEDCLFLNIWVPENSESKSGLPVLVHIHGGAYKGGCGNEKQLDDPVLPQKGVITVTINYRLGPLGFACLPELEKESGHTGNYGLYDQLTALTWIKHNISAFGGDPEKVTIMGQSAGAMSVQLLCQSPLSKGLFRAAVMSSGGGAGRMLTQNPEKMYPFWKKVMRRCGCKNIEDFKNVPAEILFEEWQKAQNEIKNGSMAAVPVTDGVFVPKNPQTHKIPYMSGSTSEDMMTPVLYILDKKWGIKHRVENYVWFFDRKLPGDNRGAWHSSDLWYWFGTLPNCWRPMEEKDYRLSEEMVSYLCNFVKNGNPNGSGLPEWRPCSRKEKKVLRLGEAEPKMGKANFSDFIRAMFVEKPPVK